MTPPHPSKESAGLLLYRGKAGGVLEVLLGHPGGPFWAKRDEGAWTIPKGEVLPGEDRLTAACRETTEETGIVAEGPFVPLGAITQKAGKTVHAWAARCDNDASAIRSNPVEIEWPPRSGRRLTFPELDRAAYFTVAVARVKLNPAQVELLDRLQAAVATNAEGHKVSASE